MAEKQPVNHNVAGHWHFDICTKKLMGGAVKIMVFIISDLIRALPHAHIFNFP